MAVGMRRPRVAPTEAISILSFPGVFYPERGRCGRGRAFANVWIFLILLYLSDRRGPAASLTTEALNNAFLFSGFAEKRGGRGEVPPSAGSNYVIKSGSQRTEVAARRRKRLPS